ncbi:MAG: hydrolase TatD [Flavobacteriales bacterium]|nr:hydrolase TatD [Flavobacteriales bacterium]
MKLIDTHSHLYLEEFDKDINQIIKEAKENHVNKILLPNISSKTTTRMINLCNNFKDIFFPMAGLHPCEVSEENFKFEIDHIAKLISKEKMIAIGEIGIDLYWDQSTLSIQKQAFEKQILIAKQNNLPIVIHNRNSFNETIEIVERLNNSHLSGVFHCFTGSLKEANRIIELENFFLGIGGVLTFKNSGLDKVIENTSLKKIILETDAPYLSPHPFRGKRNVPKYLLIIAEKLAEIKNISLESVIKETTLNANKLFDLSN